MLRIWVGEIDPIEPAHATSSALARPLSSESEFCISRACVISMLDDICVFLASVLARQGPSESDYGISTKLTPIYLFASLALGFPNCPQGIPRWPQDFPNGLNMTSKFAGPLAQRRVRSSA